MFFPFVAGKGFAFRILIELLFGVFVILAFLDKEYRPKFSWLTKSILLFTGIILLADLLGENPYKSIWSNYERMEGFMFILHLSMYYMVASSVIKTKEGWNKLFNISIGASVIMSLYALLQKFGEIKISRGAGAQLDGTLGNSTYLAIYMVFHIFLCLYMLVSESNKKWQKWIYGIIIAVETFVLYFTATRGAILGILGGLFLMGVLLVWKGKENKLFKKIAIWIMGGVVVLVLGFAVFRDTSFIKNSPVLSRFSVLSFAELQTQGRYYVWPMAMKGVAERPLLGWGQENFNFVFNKNYNPGLFGQEEWFDRTHNTFLDWMIAGGIIGFLAYISIYIALFYLVWKKDSPLNGMQKSVLTGMISAYIFHNIFVFDNLISYIIFFSILAYVHSTSTMLAGNNPVQSKFYTKTFSADSLNYVVFPLVVLCTAGMIYFVNVPAIQANTTLIQALANHNNDLEKNLELFKKVFSYNSFGSGEAVEHLAQTTSRLATLQVPNDIKQKFYDYTKERIEIKVAQNPNDARYLVFAGSFFNKFGQYDEAMKYLERALIESPDKQSIHFELGASYLGKKDYKKMMELFKRAYDLKPSSTESQIIYTAGAIYAKDEAVLREMEKIVPRERVIEDQRFLNAYSTTGDYNTVLAILTARLEKDPTNLQTKYTMAEVYSILGQKQKAINLINEMIAQQPSFKEQGEAAIKIIQSR